MKLPVSVILLLAVSSPVSSGDLENQKKIELSAGYSFLIYQSIFSMQGGYGLEVAVRRQIVKALSWQAGMRFGSSPVHPEGFLRILTVQKFGAWRPMVGGEVGLTSSARFDEGAKLLRETRQAMERNISHIYCAGYAAPLSFEISARWRLNVLGIQFGSHLGHTGRTTRVQLGVISLGRTW
ncbi:MAG TPA: hypothetical protein PLG50_09660 [bacterium]|nr:hypothetical protein [bacterium]HQG45914.1 hypothetical protein [bacterium]HQI48879.1 hypothetical protein [bacterium]HQJ66134.1 hypothetical protein [bacterium]